MDHGKSSLIVRLTGIDPDRWEEEKRRGLTIDLGFAWCTLPSGREIGFVDVPGHERFVRNMLAGVGPVRLVLLVVAADEGWKPQSEEHLEIVDVLGAHAGVVALTKRDLVDDAVLQDRRAEVRERLAGTALADAPIVACSSASGEGVEEVRAALDAMVGGAPQPADEGRPRIHVDRSFTIRGAGTVVTGTLTGGTLGVEDEVVIHPGGASARIRALQTHKRAVDTARPVSRVAANLAGLARNAVERGNALTRPGQWRPTTLLEARLVPVRSLAHPLTARGAFKLYSGSSERDARLRLYGPDELLAGDSALARISLARPVVAAVGDRFVLREAGRRETVAGGTILDTDPPSRPGADPERRLARREAGEDLPTTIVAERGAVRAADLTPLVGHPPTEIAGAARVGTWWAAEPVLDDFRHTAAAVLEAYHRAHPLRTGADAAVVRAALVEGRPDLRHALERGLAGDALGALEAERVLVREGTTVRLAGHRVSLEDPVAERLVAEVAAGEPSPPTVRDLLDAGHPRDLIDAAVATGRLVRVSPDLVLTPGFAARAEAAARKGAAEAGGLTVSRYRESLGTTRRYALPLLAWLDARGITRRVGDVRRPGVASA